MKKSFAFLIALFLCIPFFSFSSVQAGSITQMVSSEENTNNEKSLFQTLSTLRNLNNTLLTLKIELRQAKGKIFPEKEEKDQIAEQLKNQNEILIRQEQKEANTKNVAKLKENIEDTRFLLEEKSRLFHDLFELHEEKKRQVSSDITNTEAEIEKLKEVAKNQAVNLVIRLGFFLGFILLLLLLRFLSGKMIRRLSGRIPVPRERALFRINTIVFNILIAISILVALFSQFVSFIPLLAIVGTGLAFALRDIISSSIAWFVIGTDQGYKIGDLIEADAGKGKFRGRVIEVHPLLTVLRQTGMRGDTGQVISFPNKLIFEQQIRNFSKMYRFTFIMIEFLLEKESDTETAHDDLYSAIKEENSKDIEEARKNLPNLQVKFGLSEEQIMPQIFIEPDPKGISLRGKYFCRLESRHASRTKITRNFLKRIQGHPNIKLRFVQFGEKEEM